MKSSKRWYVPAIAAGSLLVFVSLIPASRNESVVIPWLYTGSDGRTHAEGTEARFVTRADGIGQSPLVKASGFFYLKLPAGYVQQWHPAPRRQYVIEVSAELKSNWRASYPGQTHIAQGSNNGPDYNGPDHDVGRDGRFPIDTEIEATSTEPVHLLIHWRPPTK